MKRISFYMIISLLTLFSCTNTYVVEQGIVIEKRHTPALYYGLYGPPEDEYLLRLRIIENDKKKKVYVTKQIFDSVEVGDTFPIIE